jgi:hypothetical protein
MPFRLREFDFATRLAITCLVLVFAGGFAASAAHLVEHHENRDERPGVSLEDLEGAYHGVRVTAPLILALERNHPDDLSDADHKILADWLAGARISEDFDNLDLGDSAPAEILGRSCMPCHSHAEATDEAPPLEYWEDVSKVAFSREVEPVPVKILAASTHTHALTLGALSLAIGLLWLATRWPRGLKSWLFALSCLALFVDLACWWLSRDNPGLVVLIAASGAVYAGTSVLFLLGILADLWLPKSRGD